MFIPLFPSIFHVFPQEENTTGHQLPNSPPQLPGRDLCNSLPQHVVWAQLPPRSGRCSRKVQVLAIVRCIPTCQENRKMIEMMVQNYLFVTCVFVWCVCSSHLVIVTSKLLVQIISAKVEVKKQYPLEMNKQIHQHKDWGPMVWAFIPKYLKKQRNNICACTFTQNIILKFKLWNCSGLKWFSSTLPQFPQCPGQWYHHHVQDHHPGCFRLLVGEVFQEKCLGHPWNILDPSLSLNPLFWEFPLAFMLHLSQHYHACGIFTWVTWKANLIDLFVSYWQHIQTSCIWCLHHSLTNLHPNPFRQRLEP